MLTQDGKVEKRTGVARKGRSPIGSQEQEHPGVFHPRSKVVEYVKEKAPEGRGRCMSSQSAHKFYAGSCWKWLR